MCGEKDEDNETHTHNITTKANTGNEHKMHGRQTVSAKSIVNLMRATYTQTKTLATQHGQKLQCE